VSITLKHYNTFGVDEINAVSGVLADAALGNEPLSGFIAGPPDQRDVPNGGKQVTALEEYWCGIYGSKHAISFNSATSALFAASGAIGLKPGDHIISTPWTMSATVAAPKFYGVTVDFADIEDKTFCINPEIVEKLAQELPRPKAVFAVNLFGHCAQIHVLREICDKYGMFLIEDACQAPRARDTQFFSGTVGDIGIYSLNRHKHINCGEGGIAITDNDKIAKGMRSVRNHGIDPLGLNLRMTEIEAAIALSQAKKIDKHCRHARELGNALSEGLQDLFEVPHIRPLCGHDFYLWVGKPRDTNRELKVPHIKGFIQPLHKIFTGGYDFCPVVERMRETVICFETAKYDVDPGELIEAFRE